jgi:hypothetical protein
VPYSPPGVDCDVGNLALDKKHGLTLKKRALERIVPLRECIAHAQAKEFVFFYELGSNASQKMAVERLTKYLGRGWVRRWEATSRPLYTTLSTHAASAHAPHRCGGCTAPGCCPASI